jgi:splicing factor U2AF subunit
VFIEYESVEGAQAAMKALSGRKFANRIIVTAFFPLERYRDQDFS